MLNKKEAATIIFTDVVFSPTNMYTCCPRSHGLLSKKLSVSVAVPPAPVRVPSQMPLAPSVASVANDKGDNEMILGAEHRSPGIWLTAKENPRNPQLGDVR